MADLFFLLTCTYFRPVFAFDGVFNNIQAICSLMFIKDVFLKNRQTMEIIYFDPTMCAIKLRKLDRQYICKTPVRKVANSRCFIAEQQFMYVLLHVDSTNQKPYNVYKYCDAWLTNERAHIYVCMYPLERSRDHLQCTSVIIEYASIFSLKYIC